MTGSAADQRHERVAPRRTTAGSAPCAAPRSSTRRPAPPSRRRRAAARPAAAARRVASAETRIRSNGASSGRPSTSGSAGSIRGLRQLLRREVRRGRTSTSSGTISTPTTATAGADEVGPSRAVVHPDPQPTSSTRVPGRTSSSRSIVRTVLGWLLVWPCPIGSGPVQPANRRWCPRQEVLGDRREGPGETRPRGRPAGPAHAVAGRRPRSRLGRLDLAVLGRRRGGQLPEQPARWSRRPRARPGRTRPGWPATAGRSADLADVLQRRGVHLVRGGGRLEVVQGPDVAAHAVYTVRRPPGSNVTAISRSTSRATTATRPSSSGSVRPTGVAAGDHRCRSGPACRRRRRAAPRTGAPGAQSCTVVTTVRRSGR